MTSLDAERERWSPADFAVADPDDLVPVAGRPPESEGCASSTDGLRDRADRL
jgi:hypothetical protein